MNTRRIRIAAPSLVAAACLLHTLSLLAAPRSWTTPQGAVMAEYLGSTTDTVTVRGANGQALRLRLADLGPDDRSFVAQKQAEAIEANKIDAKFKGEVVWRLPIGWSSLSWSNTQDAEIWLWDDKTKKPAVKLVDVKVEYHSNTTTRNQFEGTYTAQQPVHIAKDARVVVKAKFRATVNNKQKDMEELSVPMPLPALNKGEIKLPAVRLSLTH